MNNEVETVVEPKARKEKPPVIPTPNIEVSGRKPIRFKFHVGKSFHQGFVFPHSDMRKKPTHIYHLYPLLSEWIGRTIPDGVNPRSHDPECLKSPVAKAIETTINDRPEDFYLANRGATLIADDIKFDSAGNVELVINDPENQGLADGATTDAVLAKVQTRLARELTENNQADYSTLLESKVSLPETLKNGRIHLEVIVGLEDRDRIANLVEGRNTSRQVRGWSMADFRGEFEFIKKTLDADSSPFKDKVGYEENSSRDVNILDVLSILTLFHPEWDEKDGEQSDKGPTIAYANKGRLNMRLDDKKVLKGYEGMIPVLEDILRLHDYVYATFEAQYDKAMKGKSRFGRREGIQSRLLTEPYSLPLTGTKSSYIIPAGFIFPLLASFRALITYRGGKAHWKVNPMEHWDKCGARLVKELFEQVDAVGGNPNVAGKRKLTYTAVHKEMQLTLVKNEDK